MKPHVESLTVQDCQTETVAQHAQDRINEGNISAYSFLFVSFCFNFKIEIEMFCVCVCVCLIRMRFPVSTTLPYKDKTSCQN